MQDKYIIKFSQEFEDSLSLLLSSRKSLGAKILLLKNNLKKYGVSQVFYKIYDVQKLFDNFYRIKFPPYRIIVKIDGDIIYLENIFKRKGSSDYKKYA